MTSAVGTGLAPTLDALRHKRSGLARRAWETVDLDTCIGEVADLDAVEIRPDLRAFDCRNNRLAQLALVQDGFEDAVRGS
ncbi:MAG: beta-ketoacyl-[acyl-carrier-protein] synthase II, partial [Ramlibacter sp.]